MIDRRSVKDLVEVSHGGEEGIEAGVGYVVVRLTVFLTDGTFDLPLDLVVSKFDRLHLIHGVELRVRCGREREHRVVAHIEQQFPVVHVLCQQVEGGQLGEHTLHLHKQVESLVDRKLGVRQILLREELANVVIKGSLPVEERLDVVDGVEETQVGGKAPVDVNYVLGYPEMPL